MKRFLDFDAKLPGKLSVPPIKQACQRPSTTCLRRHGRRLRDGGDGPIAEGGDLQGAAGDSQGAGGEPRADGGEGGAAGQPGSAGEPAGGVGGDDPSGGTSGTGTSGAGMGMGGSAGTGQGGSGGVPVCSTTPSGQDPAECGPLMMADLLAVETASLPGFHVGFRAKSLSVCALEQDCIYFSQRLGSVQSGTRDARIGEYEDGDELMEPRAVKIRIDVGAASQADNPPLEIQAGEKVTLIFVPDARLQVYFPRTEAQSIVLYVRVDGSTFYDAALTEPAAFPAMAGGI